MSEVSTHPMMEGVARKLFGIEGVPPGEAGRMVNRAVKVAAEMYDHLEEQRDIYADAAYRWWKQARVNNACVWAHIRNFERALREAEDLTRERDEWQRRAEAAEEDLHGSYDPETVWQLRSENARYREALEWYADHDDVHDPPLTSVTAKVALKPTEAKTETCYRYKQVEFKWSGINQKYELVEWAEDNSHCWVVAFFEKHSEGYDMRTVGTRYFDSGHAARIVAEKAMQMLAEIVSEEVEDE